MMTWAFSLKEETRNFLAANKSQVRFTKPSKYLRGLHLNFPTRIPEKSFKDLSQYFKGFVTLETLSITLQLSSDLKNPKMCYLSEGLKRISSLRSLELCFSEWCKIIDRRFDILQKGLRRPVSLRNFSLSFNQCLQITNLTIHNLCEDLKNFILLQRLRLDFSLCGFITNEGLLRINRLLKKLKNLFSANFCFDCCSGVSLLGVVNIFQDLETPNSLQVMKINYSGSTYEVLLCDFEETSKRNISLQMKFSFTSLRTEFERLRNVLKKLPVLQTIDFKFECSCKIQASEWKYFGQALEVLTLLQSLNFKFSMDFKVTNEGLKEISQPFMNLKNLKQISLECISGHQISNLGVENFVKSLKNLIGLQGATLIFSPDIGIMKAEEQEKIIEILKSHPSLLKGILNFGFSMKNIEVLKC